MNFFIRDKVGRRSIVCPFLDRMCNREFQWQESFGVIVILDLAIGLGAEVRYVIFIAVFSRFRTVPSVCGRGNSRGFGPGLSSGIGCLGATWACAGVLNLGSLDESSIESTQVITWSRFGS
jgi:hypothetical protein